MTVKDFDELFEYIVDTARATLVAKGHEYSTDDDRLHNFKRAAMKAGTTRAKALMGMKLKHDVSVDDLVQWNETAPDRITPGLIKEKLQDSINYNILLWAILLEDYELHKISKNT